MAKLHNPNFINHVESCAGDLNCIICGRPVCRKCSRQDSVSTDSLIPQDKVGFCLICAGVYNSSEIGLHSAPNEKSVMIMPKAKFKKGQNVSIAETYDMIDYIDLALLINSGTTFEKENLMVQRGSKCKIIGKGIHPHRKDLQWIYLVRVLKTGVDYLFYEKGLEPTPKFKHYPFHVGQKIIVRNEFYTFPSIRGNPSGTYEMREFIGKEGYISKVVSHPSCPFVYYNITTDEQHYQWNHHWLEPISPILRKNGSVPIDLFTVTDRGIDNKEQYLQWIQYGDRGERRTGKSTPDIPLEFKRGETNLKTIRIHEDVFKKLYSTYCEFISYWGYNLDESYSQAKPCVFLLGERKGKIIKAIPLNYGSFMKKIQGCGQMTGISTGELSIAMTEMYALDINPCGIARVGAFLVGKNYYRGSSVEEIRDATRSNFYILSLGRNGMAIETGGTGYYNNYIISDFKRKKGGVRRNELIDIGRVKF